MTVESVRYIVMTEVYDEEKKPVAVEGGTDFLMDYEDGVNAYRMNCTACRYTLRKHPDWYGRVSLLNIVAYYDDTDEWEDGLVLLEDYHCRKNDKGIIYNRDVNYVEYTESFFGTELIDNNILPPLYTALSSYYRSGGLF